MKKKKSRKTKISMSPNRSELQITVRSFAEAPEDKRFVLQDGRLLKDLKELADALEHMSEEVFTHHANSSKNDFSSWVRDVLCESELAEDIAKAENQMRAQIAVLKHIAKKAF